MGVALASGDGDARVQDGAGFFGARLFGEELGVHKIAGDVLDVALEEFAEVEVGARGIAGIGALEGEAVTRESVVGFFGDVLFEHLAAGFLLFGHGRVRIIAGNWWRQDLWMGRSGLV